MAVEASGEFVKSRSKVPVLRASKIASFGLYQVKSKKYSLAFQKSLANSFAKAIALSRWSRCAVIITLQPSSWISSQG